MNQFQIHNILNKVNPINYVLRLLFRLRYNHKISHDVSFDTILMDDLISDGDINTTWVRRFPWYSNNKDMYTTYKDGVSMLYGDIHIRVRLGEYGIPSMWLLNLEEGKVQEIDVFERMKDKLYFSIHSNRKTNNYYIYPNCVKTPHPDYAVVQSKVKDYIESTERYHTYSLIWRKRYVLWKIDGIAVAISFRRVPTQKMWLVLSNVDLSSFGYIIIKQK